MCASSLRLWGGLFVPFCWGRRDAVKGERGDPGERRGRSVLVRVSSVEVLFLFSSKTEPLLLSFLVLGRVVVIKSFGHPHACSAPPIDGFCFDLSPCLVYPSFLAEIRCCLSSTPPPAPRLKSPDLVNYIYFSCPSCHLLPLQLSLCCQQTTPFTIHQTTFQDQATRITIRKHGHPQRPQPQAGRHLRR